MVDTTLTSLKQCSKCGIEYPATIDYFRLKRGKLKMSCIACDNARAKLLYAQRSPEQIKRTQERGKSESKREYMQQYHIAHKEHRNEYSRNYHEQHPEQFKEYGAKRWREHRNELTEGRKNWYVKNRDRLNARLREAYKADPERFKAIGHNRRARKAGNGGTHTSEDIRLQIRSQTDRKGKLRCWWCSKPIRETYHLDHRIPLAKGGSNAPENLCISCPDCNLQKYDKLPQEWNGRLL